MIKSLGSNEEPLRKLITIVMTDFYKKLSDEGRSSVNNKLLYGGGRLVGRTGGQFTVAYMAGNMILRKATSTLVYKNFVRFGASVALNMVMLQGLIEEAGRASRRMKSKYPMLYYKVESQRLDMVYFLVENYLEPYIKYINSTPAQCKRIDNELNKIVIGKNW
ncbi:hypothetical protein ACUTQ5_09205 [Serratia sp. NA_112.1]|uniref:hypothetical protein n=1 Tax=Serratia sp. NA_112.1 TaxID=3415665 RepID=UPI004046E959